ncbi:MAG TPA: phage terminase large subunit, partial [Methanocorpusculum sp.]|nr:phage terminase large subunit [Methanocorpusculum sp.]
MDAGIRQAFVPTPRQEEARMLIRRCKYTLLAGGSRSGKTALFIYYLICRALLEPCRQAVLRFHFNDVKRSIGMDTLPKVLDLMGCTNYVLNKSDWVYSIPTMSGKMSEIWLGGLDDKERVEKILGNEYATIYINEASQVSYQAYTTALTRLSQNTGLENKVFIDCNPPEKSHWLYQMFVLKKEPGSGKDLPFPELYGMMQMNPVDNPHLPRDYIDHVLAVLPERQKQRFLYGEWLDKRDGSLWTRTAIDANRIDMPRRTPTLRVIAVDPAVTAHASSDETGIVIVSRDYAGHMYVEEDLSGTYTPAVWAALVMQKYADRHLDAVVAEVNQGGDFIET